VQYFFFILLSYLLGSIPTALWVGKLFFKIDIREHGSKNMGASNTFRVMGPVYGLLVLLVDMGKGFLAVKLTTFLEYDHSWYFDPALWELICGLTAIAGHVFPLFAGFRGGKGVATLFGVVLAIQPWTALISVLAFLLVVVLTKYISLGSLTGVIVFSACVWFAWKDENIYLRWFSLISALLVFFLHRQNISRLLKGKENQIRVKKNKGKQD
jgi:glycerol-3-phosphate acyltransferase PlsY